MTLEVVVLEPGQLSGPHSKPGLHSTLHSVILWDGRPPSYLLGQYKGQIEAERMAAEWGKRFKCTVCLINSVAQLNFKLGKPFKFGAPTPQMKEQGQLRSASKKRRKEEVNTLAAAIDAVTQAAKVADLSTAVHVSSDARQARAVAMVGSLFSDLEDTKREAEVALKKTKRKLRQTRAALQELEDVADAVSRNTIRTEGGEPYLVTRRYIDALDRVLNGRVVTLLEEGGG